jgi:hypothetical protein
MLPFRFTGKELDEETGLYYYGARYLDPRVSRWLSADPAMGDYIPEAPVDEEARRRNGNLPGQGGIYNWVNLHAYHYAGNNPVKYIDPDGRELNYRINDNNTVSLLDSSDHEVGRFGVTQFETTKRNNNFGNIIIGAIFEMKYEDMGSGYSDFNFVQLVRSTDKGTRIDVSPEGSLYNTKEMTEIFKSRGYVSNGAYFYDSPSRTDVKSSFQWKAETSIVGKNKEGRYEILATVGWGFRYNPDTQSLPTKIMLTLDSPSELQQKTVNDLNQ